MDKLTQSNPIGETTGRHINSMEFIRAVFRDLSERRQELGRLILWTFVLATILALTASGASYLRDVMTAKAEATKEFWDDWLWMSIWLYAWLLIVPVIYALAFQVTLEPASAGRIVAVYLGGFAFAYVVHVGIQIGAMILPTFRDVHPNWRGAVIHHMLSGLLLLAVTYGGVAALCHAIAGHRRSREVEMRRVLLESELVQARMHALRNQLQPHFLFNALNSVSSLMYRDVKAADEMLTGISDLLRVLIKDSDRYLITLREELEFVSMYLSVEKIRYGDRLQIVIDHDTELDEALVPALILQPIVENAIKHAASRVAKTAKMHVSAERQGASLRFSVADNGPGFEYGQGEGGDGTGLSNLRARLSQLYGNAQELTVESSSDGATVEIEIPFRTQKVSERLEVPAT